MGRRHQPVQAVLDLLGERPRVGVGHAHGPRAVAAPEERLLLGDGPAVPLERRARRAEVHRLPLALRVLGEALEILGDVLRSLGPRRRVARIAQHHRARLEPHERRDPLAGGRGQTQRGHRAGRDLLIDGHETVHREQAQDADAGEHDDHECRSQKDFGPEPHAPPQSCRPGRPAGRVAGGAAGAS